LVENDRDKFCRANDLLSIDNCYVMDNLTEPTQVLELIKFNVEDAANIKAMSEDILNMISSKSFKGNPLFIIDIMNSLVECGNYLRFTTNEVSPTEEFEIAYEHNDWSRFKVPIRMEKIIGNIIDSLKPKEIILLKYASIIGNLFDLDKMTDLNPFDSITTDDLVNIMADLENAGLIEILYDLNPKQIVYKFCIPFLREILYQRMLIEKRNDIHLQVARKLQDTKFSYMPQSKETYLLQTHLKIAEKSIINYMEEDDDNQNQGSTLTKSKNLSLNSMKILYVKDICEKLKQIDLRINTVDNDYSKRSMPMVKSGALKKKSDKNITWEW
jgi:adenylate cyclase 10